MQDLTAATNPVRSQSCNKAVCGGSAIRIPITKRDLGSPMRVPLYSSGEQVCYTPASKRATPKSRHCLFSATSPQHSNCNAIPETNHQPATLEVQSAMKIGALKGSAVRIPICGQEQNMVRHVWNASVTSNAQKTLKTPKFLQFGPECTPKQSIVPVTEQETITPRALFSAPASHPTLCESSSVHVVCNDAQQPAVDVVHQHCQAEFPSERHCNSLLKSPAIRVRITRPQEMVKHMTHSHPSQHMVHNNGSQLRRQDNPVVSAEMAEADKLALFLRSPAIRVRKQDPKQQVEKTPVHSSKSLRVRCKVAPVNLVEQQAMG
ncbi:unnamed protein product [Sphagnum jensenii]|uniref:Uncharacterized protein n=2 Tax=Sphagnum jensenii TaxID=128206 RepID=A0ABP0ZY08_9BRYO